MAENTKPDLESYLRKLAPDPEIVDLVEKFGAQRPGLFDSNGKYKEFFFYSENKTTFNNGGLYRWILKIEPTSDNIALENLSEKSVYIKFKKDGESYLVILFDSPQEIQLNNGYFICGVAF